MSLPLLVAASAGEWLPLLVAASASPSTPLGALSLSNGRADSVPGGCERQPLDPARGPEPACGVEDPELACGELAEPVERELVEPVERASRLPAPIPDDKMFTGEGGVL
jgi:hypothetical protein